MSSHASKHIPTWLPSLMALLLVVVLLGLGAWVFLPSAGGTSAAGSPQSDPVTLTSEQSGSPTQQSGNEQSGAQVTSPEGEELPQSSPSQRPQVELSVPSVLFDPTTGLSARSVVADVVDESGTCTLTASSGDVTIEVSGEAMPSADSMNCARDLDIPADDLTDGTWSVTVSYESLSGSGSSPASSIVVVR